MEVWCAGCKEVIKPDSKFHAGVGGNWHLSCLICSHCGCSLVSNHNVTYNKTNEKLYCSDCLCTLFLVCAECLRPCRTRFISAFDKIWHTYHFTCTKCRIVLTSYVGKHGEPYCEDCSNVYAPMVVGATSLVAGNMMVVEQLELKYSPAASLSSSSSSNIRDSISSSDLEEAKNKLASLQLEDKSDENRNGAHENAQQPSSSSHNSNGSGNGSSSPENTFADEQGNSAVEGLNAKNLSLSWGSARAERMQGFMTKKPSSMRIQVHVPVPFQLTAAPPPPRLSSNNRVSVREIFTENSDYEEESEDEREDEETQMRRRMEEEEAIQAGIKKKMEEEINRIIKEALGVSGARDENSVMARKRRMRNQYHEALVLRQVTLRKLVIGEVLVGVTLRRTPQTPRPPRPQHNRGNPRREIMKEIRVFHEQRTLRPVPASIPSRGPHDLLLSSIRDGRKLRQVVGKQIAEDLLPPIPQIIWKDRKCFGVTYRDIHPLLLDHLATRDIVDRLASRHCASNITTVIAVLNEAAIFFASKLAVKLCAGFAAVQTENRTRSYIRCNTTPIESLVGGNSRGVASKGRKSELCAAMGLIREGDRCLIVDDILDGGVSLAAAEALACAIGAEVVECLCIIELVGLGGRERLHGSPLYTLLQFDDNKGVLD